MPVRTQLKRRQPRFEIWTPGTSYVQSGPLYSDFYMPRPVKDAITGAHVLNDEEVIYAAHSWLCGPHKTFFPQLHYNVCWTVDHVLWKVVRLCSNMTHFVLVCSFLRIAVIYWLSFAIRSIITNTALSNIYFCKQQQRRRRHNNNNNNINNNVTKCGWNSMTTWE
jgi:hypothetical protein